jgi:hypothetical protein
MDTSSWRSTLLRTGRYLYCYYNIKINVSYNKGANNTMIVNDELESYVEGMAIFKVLSQHFHAGTEENHVNSGQPLSGPGFESRTSRTGNRSAIHSPAEALYPERPAATVHTLKLPTPTR